jgi:hypothetical protein
MNISGVRRVFKECNFMFKRDDAGDLWFCLKTPDFVLSVIPCIRRMEDGILFSPAYSVSSESFSRAVEYIYGENNENEPIISSFFEKASIEILKSEISKDDIKQVIKRLIDWAENADIDDGLKKYRELPTTAKGAYPLRHLAALAYNGDTAILQLYQNAFNNGDNLDFVPYITKEMIDRAVEWSITAPGSN